MPNIFALNRGKNLQNIALWLAIFAGLAVIYKNFGPESPAPLFHLPESMQRMNRKESPQILPLSPRNEEKKDDAVAPQKKEAPDSSI
ncbi:MAG: hypothetical protein PHW76_06575 [Alphaproteobacteria bacterium]|nr:hypothetical protein [Alphaproteobacteria bacterium]